RSRRRHQLRSDQDRLAVALRPPGEIQSAPQDRGGIGRFCHLCRPQRAARLNSQPGFRMVCLWRPNRIRRQSMKLPRRTMSFALALCLAAPVGASLAAEKKAKAAPDENAAIALAEKASLPLIGADQMASARPFKATQHGDIWLVISQPVPDPKNPAAG